MGSTPVERIWNFFSSMCKISTKYCIFQLTSLFDGVDIRSVLPAQTIVTSGRCPSIKICFLKIVPPSALATIHQGKLRKTLLGRQTCALIDSRMGIVETSQEVTSYDPRTKTPFVLI